MKIVKINNEDIDLISEIESKLFHDNSLYSKNILISCFNNKDCIFVKCTNNNQILGYMIAYKLTDHIDLVKIGIIKSFQHNKYGTSLIEYLHKYNLPIFAEVNSNNEIAYNFYLKNGFKKINIRKKYYENNDGILLKKL